MFVCYARVFCCNPVMLWVKCVYLVVAVTVVDLVYHQKICVGGVYMIRSVLHPVTSVE